VRLTTGILLWAVAASAATAVGLVAVSAIGTDIFGGGQDPLSQSQVDDLLASSTTAPPTTTPPPTTTSSTPPQEPEGTPTVTEGGTVIARCTTGGLVEIMSATPAQGYAVDGDDDIEDHPSVKFTSGHTEIEVRLRCVNGAPDAEVRYDD
jgi:hypothetical protein